MTSLKKYIVYGLMSASLLGLASGCTDNVRSESTGEYIDDVVLSAKIRASFVGDAKLEDSNINVETFKGVVQLSGFVDSQAQSDRAVQLARTIKGVKAVHNSLIVKQ